MRKLRHGNYMLYRQEDEQNVYLYGYFQWQELKKEDEERLESMEISTKEGR